MQSKITRQSCPALGDVARARPALMTGLAVVLALLLPADALAQARVFYGADGKVSARVAAKKRDEANSPHAGSREVRRGMWSTAKRETAMSASGARTTVYVWRCQIPTAREWAASGHSGRPASRRPSSYLARPSARGWRDPGGLGRCAGPGGAGGAARSPDRRRLGTSAVAGAWGARSGRPIRRGLPP